MSNKFSGSTPLIKPPAYCKTFKGLLPDVPDLTAPPQLQGFARWTDPDPLGPLDIAMAVPMNQVGSAWQWTGERTVQGTLFIITFDQIAAPDLWTITLDVWRTPTAHEGYTFPQFQMPLDFPWDTYLLTHSVIYGKDYRSAQVAM